MLPYPGRYESHHSWSARCDEYERDQARWRREQASRSTNWGGYNYRHVKGPGTYSHEGFTIPFIRCYPSTSKRLAAHRFAEKTSGCVVVKAQLGNPRLITSREDYFVVKMSSLPPMLPSNCAIDEPQLSPRKIYTGIYSWQNKYPSYAKAIDEVLSNDDH